MNIERAKEEIKNTVKAYLAKDEDGNPLIPSVHQRPVLLIGPPGIGKTAIMDQAARECGISLAAYTMTHHTRQSAMGLPFIDKKVYDGNEYSVWFDETGMQIAVGHTVTDQILDKAFLSWEDVSGRIHQLLDQGEYAPQSVLDAARSNAVKEHAQALAYMKGDMAEGVADIVPGGRGIAHLSGIFAVFIQRSRII